MLSLFFRLLRKLAQLSLRCTQTQRLNTSGDRDMKNKILIIKDNAYTFFTTKQVLELQLRLETTSEEVSCGQSLAEITSHYKPNQVIFQPGKGIVELVEKLKAKGVNKRNTVVCVVYAKDFEDNELRQICDFAKLYPKMAKAA